MSFGSFNSQAELNLHNLNVQLSRVEHAHKQIGKDRDNLVAQRDEAEARLKVIYPAHKALARERACLMEERARLLEAVYDAQEALKATGAAS